MNTSHVPPRHAWLLLVRPARLALHLVLLAGFTWAAEASKHSFDLASGAAERALKQFSAQSGHQVIVPTDLVQGIRTSAVRGEFTPGDALARLLANTGLVARFDAATGAFAIVRANPETSPAPKAVAARADASPLARAAEKPAGEAPVELSPFEVRAEGDVGYQAANTTSGSRLNSRLKDTPAALSAFTPEFLTDVAATNLQEMLGHANNVEPDFEDANAGFTDSFGRGADGTDFTFRVRGLPAGTSRDFVESSIPVDLYNVERAEVSSGPNSILFGLGPAGGLVSLTGKKANLQRTRTTLKSMLGTWHYERYEADHNQVLIPRKLSLRLLGLYQNNQGWRYWDFNDQARWSVAGGGQPFKNTVVHASFEKGHFDNNISIASNAYDQITAWLDAGKPLSDTAIAPPGAIRFGAAAQRFTFVDQTHTISNYRGEFQTVNRYGAVQTLLPPSVSPYDYNLTGPGGTRHQSFDSRQLTVQQRFPRGIVAELAYFRNTTDSEAHTTGQAAGTLYADPNPTLPRPDGAAGTIPNPFVGRPYFEASWVKGHFRNTNEIYRLSAAIDVGRSERWFGRHRIAALGEISRQDRHRDTLVEILVDDRNVPIVNAAGPEDVQNRLTRRSYIVEGDYRTYYAANPTFPVAQFVYNGRTFHNAYLPAAQNLNLTSKDITSVMVASQSFWWKDRLVTTLGARRDDIGFKDGQKSRVTDPNDPRVVSQQLVAGEWAFNGGFLQKDYLPATFTAGGVLHATRRLSVFYNLSRNNGQPAFDRTVLPHGSVPEPMDGRGRDYGLMLDVLGDDRYFIRATWFQTEQHNDASIRPGPNQIGVDNHRTMLAQLQAVGKITQAEYDREDIVWNATTIDTATSGLEVEAVANPTKNLTLRVGYSHSKRRRENFFQEIYEFFDARIPSWRQQLAGNPTELAIFETAVRELYDELDFQTVRQNSPFGSRPHKLNGTARYRFSEGRLKGAFVGGSIRYNGKVFMSWDPVSGHIYWGNESVLGDVFTGCRFRLPWSKASATLQLNVRNVSDSYRATAGRYNATYTGVAKVYLNEPRSYRLTTTWEF